MPFNCCQQICHDCPNYSHLSDEEKQLLKEKNFLLSQIPQELALYDNEAEIQEELEEE